MNKYSTHHCGQLRSSDVGQRARLSGWVQRRHDLGGILFLDLRDHFGVTQVVIEPDRPFSEEARKVRPESVVCVEGPVARRTAGADNPNLTTGEIELRAEKYEVLSMAEQLPFPPGDASVAEALRLKFRFLDLRGAKQHQNIVLRSNVIASLRRRMIEQGFQEFQTPILTSSSPEGARDYLVPSRLHPGKFYALPQAPQQFKQLLMVAGFHRYFQIAPCFRDEDARADRSPGEFYQLDAEMSFVEQDDVFAAIEPVLYGVFKEFAPAGWEITPPPFPRITYADSMRRYGSDKPDLRLKIEWHDVGGLFAESNFEAFKKVVAASGTVRALAAPNLAAQPRSFFDTLNESVRAEGGGGVTWALFGAGGAAPKGPVVKFLDERAMAAVRDLPGAADNGGVLFLAGPDPATAKIANRVRTEVGTKLDLFEKNAYRFCWVVDFPMFERDPETSQVVFSHNPFSMPQGGMEALNTMDPLAIKAFQYDIVCNGTELSSGAIRNHKPEIMYRAFEIAGYRQEDVDARFGGMIRAFRFGAPPHGGLAPGVDRIVMLLAQEPNIREVIAFPMTAKAEDLLMGAPSAVTEKQLNELHIRLKPPPPPPPRVEDEGVRG